MAASADSRTLDPSQFQGIAVCRLAVSWFARSLRDDPRSPAAQPAQ